MEFLITEKQLRKILSESKNDSLTDAMKIFYSFVVNMLRTVKKSYNLNLKMLLTWGTSVGGFLLPLDNYIKNGNFDVTDEQRMLILCGITFILLFEGKRGVQQVLKKIKEENLESEFETVLSKAKQLKEAFQGFMSVTLSSTEITLEIISYSFLLPIVTDLLNFGNQSTSMEETALLVSERLLASGLVLMTKEVLSKIIKNILELFK